MRHRAIWPLCLFLLLLCFAPLCRAAEPGSDTAQKLFLWKVSGPAGTVYLFGTIHVGRTDFYPLAPVIEASFKAADTLITEADLIESGDTDRLLKILLQKGTYPAGDSVENHIGQETRTHLLPYVEATQELASSYTRLKPWFLSIAITVIEAKRMGLNANDGLDRHFVDQATEMHKPGAVEQDVDRPELIGQRADRNAVPDIETAGRDKGLGEIGQLVLGDVGGKHVRSLGRKGQRRRPADPLRRRRHQGALALKPSRHAASPCRPRWWLAARRRGQIAMPRKPL